MNDDDHRAIPVSDDVNGLAPLIAMRFAIDTRHEPVVYLRADAAVARSEGFEALSRVRVEAGANAIVATLMTVSEQLLVSGHVGLSDAAMRALDIAEGVAVTLTHAPPITSMRFVRAKVYGHRLNADAFDAIIGDIVAGRYLGVHVAAFIAACAGSRLNEQEIVHLTRAMVDTGQRLRWPVERVVDKHCIGGLPGNRTTPIVVAIVAARGLTMPKTSSRAITSPAGTADTMEVLAPVELDLPTLRRVVEQEGACIAWGGSVSLSPADDILIRVERALDIDSEGQLVASVLSKKIAAGATDIVIDVPVGATAKIRSREAAAILSAQMHYVALAFGLNVRIVITDGSQPVGNGIGPALEARDVLAVLQRQPDAPQDLRERALLLAGTVLEIAGVAAVGSGIVEAACTLDDGRAWKKFEAICTAQGGLREPPVARLRYALCASRAGIVEAIDNRVVSRIAKLAGAPADKAAGVEMLVKLGDSVRAGDALMTIHAESRGELAYAREFSMSEGVPIVIGDRP